MKNTFLIAGAAIAALALASNASAETYVGVGVSQELTDVEGFSLDDGTGLDVTLGVDAANLPVRLEGRVARINNDTNVLGFPIGVDALQYSGDAYLDLDLGWNVTPYVGGGVTYTDGEVDALFTQVDASGWGWNVAGGVRAPLTESLTVDAGVRYGQSTLDVDFLGDVDVEQTQLRVGLNYAL